LKLLTRIALALGGLCAGLVVIECLLRVLVPANPFSPRFPLYPNTRTIFQVGYAGVSPRAVVTTNRWGLRGENPPARWDETYTLLTIGGSTTRCTYLDDEKTWPHLLQQNLRKRQPRVWVGNAGIDGQTTRAHILLLEEVVSRIRPNMVVFLVGINDLGLSLREDRKNLGIAADKPRSFRWRVFTWTRMGQILYDWKRVLIDKVPVVQSRPIEAFKPLTDPLPLPRDLTTLLPLQQEYRQNLRQLISRCRSLNIRPVFLTQPMLFDDTPAWRSVEGSYYWIQKTQGNLSAATHWKLMSIYNRLLLDVCRQERAACFDLASVVPHEKAYFTDSVHYTEAGAALIAEKVAAFLHTEIPNSL
jgi:lysophospholipase L1-like esterase